MNIQNGKLEFLIKQSVTDALKKQLKIPSGFSIEGKFINNDRQKYLVLIPDFASDIQNALENIMVRQPDSEFYLCFRYKLYPQLSEKNIFCLDADNEVHCSYIFNRLAEFKKVFVIQPGPSVLKQTVDFDEKIFTVKVVLGCLLRKVKVEYCFDCNPFGSAAGDFYQKVKKLAASVRSMNIGLSYPDIKAENREEISGSDVIALQDVDKMWETGVKTFYTGKNCIITPLARDRIKELGMSIV